MKLLTSTAVALVLLGAPAAFAADLLLDEETMTLATGGSWDGAYVGGGLVFESSTTIAENIVGLQGVVGVNATFDGFLIGAEAYVQPYWSNVGGFGAGLGGEVRAGLLASEQALLYGAVGAEITLAANTYATFGGGVEFMAMDNMSIDLEYKYYWGINNGWRGHHVGISANWHF